MKATLIDSIPRHSAYLQFEAVETDGMNFQVDYELVLPLERGDCRGTFDHEPKERPQDHNEIWLDSNNNKRIPLGRTNVGAMRETYPFARDGEIDLPFRDGAHSQWDNAKFGNLPIYYRINNETYLLSKES